MKNPNEPRGSSEARINANRENAKKSTGPRTAEGKAASSRNRLIHGLRANKHILLDEDPAEFLLLLHDHLDRFQPVGPAEEGLVLRIAAHQWRLNRVLPMEAGIYRDLFQKVADKDTARQEHHARKVTHAAEDGKPAPPLPIPPRRGRPPGSRFQHRRRRPQLFHQTGALRNQHRALHRPLPPPVENVPGRPPSRRPQPRGPAQSAPGRTVKPRCEPIRGNTHHNAPKISGLPFEPKK